MRQGIPDNEHNVIFVKKQHGNAYLFLRKTEGLSGVKLRQKKQKKGLFCAALIWPEILLSWIMNCVTP
ncbi:hypothetical protein [Enterobacter cloacae]|uniref:hypothetical protein n=1 Tax=Enterobacter cloacae TaxID=550 RepID=UPI0021D2BB97|nr:hypothetical protein [Enterobacter cloacae]MCU6209259.1 hypothetical protein [Enterobacter cloacae]